MLLFGISCAAALAIELELKFRIEDPLGIDLRFAAATAIRNLQTVQVASALISLSLVFIALRNRNG